MEAIHVIKRPLLSEKSTWATEDNRYTFLVACEATKTEIKRAVEEIYERVKDGEEEVLYIPPPLLLAELPEKVQFLTNGEEEELCIPPPL